MIRLCAFADEADPTLKGQIDALTRHGISYIELRGIDGKNISLVTEEEARGYKRMLDEAGIAVWSIGSPIGKVKISDDMNTHFALLHHICKLARIFGCDKIRMFSFYEAYEQEALVISTLRKMVQIAASYGVFLYHENEKEIYGDTLDRVLRLQQGVEELRFIYDPANFIECGQDPKVTLDALFPYVSYFHIKDALWDSKAIVPAGYGAGRIADLVSKIGEQNVVLTVEPHLIVFEGYHAFDKTEMQHAFCFQNNHEAFDAAVGALKGILLEAGYTEKLGGFVR